MRRSRINHPFWAVMAVSFLAAFVVPERFTTPARSPVAGVFAPVSVPVRWVAGAFYAKVHPAAGDPASPATPRAAGTVFVENARLRGSLAALQVKFDQLARVNADRQAVGDIRPLCKPAAVTGSDSSGVRDVLLIASSVAARRPVVYGTDLIGRTMSAGLTGADVQLVSDPKFAVTGRIGRYVTGGDGQIRVQFVTQTPLLVQGVGRGAMAIRSTLTMREVADLGLAVNDVVVLDDRDWPANVQGLTVGRLASVTPQRNAPLFADVAVEPVVNVRQLSEVMVMVKDQ